MKYWPILMVFVIGIVATLTGVIGILFAWPFHNHIIIGGMVFNVLAIGLFFLKVTRHKNSDSVLK